MKQFRNILWGLVLVAVGLIWGLNALEITQFNITLISGWWTLFIIIPCLIGLITEKGKTGNLIGLCIGVALLLCCRGILDFGMVLKLIFPVVLVLWGISFIFSDMFNHKVSKEIKRLSGNLTAESDYCATFSAQTANFDGEEFRGTSLNAVFGGVKCYLRNAIINEDQVINCSAIFGGIEIYVPSNVKVKIRSTSLFGGVTEKTEYSHDPDAKTIYVNATCLFGGVEIK